MDHVKDYYYQAVLSKDKRFDGIFFIGVKTTGIYCRPSCPATPKIENVVLFPNAFLAEKAGYRPCFRCHPHLNQWYPSGEATLIQRALKLIMENRCENLQDLARLLGASPRHFRRIFGQEIGLSPKQLQTHYRLNFAWQLIKENALPITEVAFAAGFSSLRSFNHAFKKRFAQAPTVLRQSSKEWEIPKDKSITLYLPYTPPLDWESLLRYFRQHQIPFLETIQAGEYQRIFSLEDKLGVLTLAHEAESNRLRLKVYYENPQKLFHIVANIRRMFDLDLNPHQIEGQFQKLPFFKALWAKRPGMRIASYWEPFEALICTILGQVVSMAQAVNLTKSLLIHYGRPAQHPLTKDNIYLFPSAPTLAESSLELIKTTNSRKSAIRKVSQLIAQKELTLTSLYQADELRKQMMAIPGIGSWTADYFLLRGLGHPDAFPDKDLVLKRNNSLERIGDIQQLRPWRSYAAVYLWNLTAEDLL